MIAELEVDLDAIATNVARLRALVAPAAFAAVVKADAYGHGLAPVSRALAGRVDAFCVYRVDEAAALRAEGIREPVLVLGPVEPHELTLAHECDAALTLWSDGAFARDAVRVARERGVPFAVHAKIDTGVTRLGLDRDRAAGVIASYLAEPAFEVRGAYTHLAAVEELASEFTAMQLAAFRRALLPVDALLAARNVRRHAAASAAAMLFPALRLDLVRVGIAAYGIWPSPLTRSALGEPLVLEPALRWTTRLVVVREVEAGRSVGYGCTFETTRRSRIGVLPIGYAEGLPRALSNRGEALVDGRRVPYVGRICMNMAFLDVTDVPGATAGATVTLLGSDGEQRIDPNDLADRADTIGYELVARLPAAIPRRYRDVATERTAVGHRTGAARTSPAP